MSIFNPIEKTPSQLRYENVKEKAGLLRKGEEARCLQSFYDLWGGNELVDVVIEGVKYGRTIANPVSKDEVQGVLDLLGSDAASVFVSHKAWQDFIKSVNPDWGYLIPPYQPTYNADGTVTL